MLKSTMLLIATIGCATLALPSQGQVQITNQVYVPATILENLENTTGQVIIKGTTPLGSISCRSAVISVTCKEDAVAGSNHKEHGIMVDIAVNGQRLDRTVIDFDELDSLISAMDYLGSVTWSVTSLSSFDAYYVTKAGLRVAVFSSKRSGQIEFGLSSSRLPQKFVLTPEQRAQFRALLDQAKTQLTALRNG